MLQVGQEVVNVPPNDIWVVEVNPVKADAGRLNISYKQTGQLFDCLLDF